MFESTIHRVPRPQDIARATTQEVRDAFLLNNLFTGGARGVFTGLDRLAVAGITPRESFELPNHKETGRATFLERRELGAINIGGPGTVTVDGKIFSLDRLDCVYAPVGSKSVIFESVDKSNPAKFYILSCPAHAAHPAAMMKPAQASPVPLGSQATANQRTIYKYIHQGGIQSCQLVMGFTALAEGNVWNTMPPHTHWRRSEVYFYFDLGENIVTHFMGEPADTRHLFVHNEEAVLSPPWSIHSGCGTANYKFIWGMAGENQAFDDMDAVKPLELR